MTKHARYTTFAPGELSARLRELAPHGTPISMAAPLTGGGHSAALFKAHCCVVTYPDAKTGDCRYERLGPHWHLFHFGYGGQSLPRQVWTRPLSNDPVSIESKARELALAAFGEAIALERQDYFRRGSEPSDGSRKKNPALFRLTAGKAREWAGQYALCRRMGGHLVAEGALYDTLDAANAAWQAKNDTGLVVACCNRLDRCWQLPRFSPLYARFDPRPKSEDLTEPMEPMGNSGAQTRRQDLEIPGPRNKSEECNETDAHRDNCGVFPIAASDHGDRNEDKEETELMSRCVGRDPQTGARCELEAAPGNAHCTPCATRAHGERRGFEDWMRQVMLAMEADYGLHPDDLPDCAYADWFDEGLTPQEAAREVMALFVDA